ncbi:MAG: alpha/beta hydrolase [Patescibacteria group bacterium]
MSSIFNKFWHKTLRRPFLLEKVIDADSGSPVVFLHGIGKTASVWKHVIEEMSESGCRLVAFDLLGFGESPKPGWLDYNVDQHAAAVIASIEKLNLTEPAVLVGHSMGCLVSVRVARLRPDLVKHLVLYEMPLYEGLPEKKRYKLRIDLYRKLYERVIAYSPTFDDKKTIRLIERIGRKVIGFEVTPETWQPFVRSLKNTIMEQTAAEDIQAIDTPMDAIYGTYDMFVIRGSLQQTFGTDSDQIVSHKLRVGHVISVRASRFIVERIQSAVIG